MPTAYITAPPDAADELAQGLVAAELAACVNLVPCRSTYRWEGTVHEDEEAVLLAKTTDDAYPELCAYVTDHHPYDVPCIERFAEEHVEAEFLAWRDGTVRS